MAAAKYARMDMSSSLIRTQLSQKQIVMSRLRPRAGFVMLALGLTVFCARRKIKKLLQQTMPLEQSIVVIP
jgi:hypothetical protein